MGECVFVILSFVLGLRVTLDWCLFHLVSDRSPCNGCFETCKNGRVIPCALFLTFCAEN